MFPSRIAGRRTLIILIMIAALIYAILLGTFLAYRWQKEQNALLRQRTIAACLGASGHIGPGVDLPRFRGEVRAWDQSI
jgi:hypothetical protein